MATKRQVKKQESKLNAMKAKAAPVVEKVAEKAAPVVEKVVEKTAPAVEKVVEKTAPAVEKAPKKEMKTTLIVEHQGKQVEDKDMIAAVKKAWTKSGRKIGDIKTMTLYVKPEEAAVYYVINTTETGSVAF